jgi:hypothetical protein
MLPLASADSQFPGGSPKKQAVFAIAASVGHRRGQKTARNHRSAEFGTRLDSFGLNALTRLKRKKPQNGG